MIKYKKILSKKHSKLKGLLFLTDLFSVCFLLFIIFGLRVFNILVADLCLYELVPPISKITYCNFYEVGEKALVGRIL